MAYLDSLPIRELAELLGELPRSRQEPLGLGMLMVALNEQLPDSYKLLPPAGHPGPGEGGRRSLRQVVVDRRAARASRHPDAPASGLAAWLTDRQQQADLHAERARAGAVAEQRVAEALRTGPVDLDPAAGRQESSDPPIEQERGWPGQERDREPRMTSATVGGPTGSAPSTSGGPTAGRYPSRRRAPSLGCRWAATTAKSTTCRRTGRAGRVRNATTTARTADLGCPRSLASPARCRGLLSFWRMTNRPQRGRD